MGGADKGLMQWGGAALARHVAERLASQVHGRVQINTNRHAEIYRSWGWAVVADDPNLPPASGPLAGIVTGFQHTTAAWVQFAPCDSPRLPLNLVERLLQAARSAGVGIAVPFTCEPAGATPRHHWTTALAHRDTASAAAGLLAQGERRVGQWVRDGTWIGVCFDSAAEFMNINTPETLHASPPP